MVTNILRLPAVKTRTGLSRSSIYALMAECKFPRQISLSSRSVGWMEAEIEQWLAQQVAESRAGSKAGKVGA